MTKQEFKKRVDKADKRLVCHDVWVRELNKPTDRFVCQTITHNISHDAEYLYQELFAPESMGIRDEYFSEHNRKNLKTRKISLRLFEQIVLDGKDYLKW